MIDAVKQGEGRGGSHPWRSGNQICGGEMMGLEQMARCQAGMEEELLLMAMVEEAGEGT